MSPRALPVAAILLAIFSLPALPQTTSSDPAAIAILTQSLTASGVANPMKPILDFVATGTITYFWGGDKITGPTTVRGRIPDLFRIDANLPAGTRSWAISHGNGVVKGTDGAINQIALHNTINLGVLTFPYLTLSSKLNDPSTAISMVGAVNLSGRQAYQIRLQRSFSKDADPDGTMAQLCTTDYFIDTLTNLVVKTVDMTHPEETFTRSYLHEIELQNHQTVNGVIVPLLVREKIDGQMVWQLSLSAISFNNGLTDLDFVIQ